MKYTSMEPRFSCRFSIPAGNRQGVAAFTGQDHVLAPSAIPSSVTKLDSFSDTATVVKVIGDAKDVKNIGMAVRSGYATAYEI